MDNIIEKSSRSERKFFRLSRQKEEEIEYLFTHLPFVPKLPTGRKDFLWGSFGLLFFGLIFSITAHSLFGDESNSVTVTFSIFFAYLVATWVTKRFLDIKPKINALFVQIFAGSLFFCSRIVNSVHSTALLEAKKNIISGTFTAGGSTIVGLTSALDAMFSFTFLFVMLYLILKRGTRKSTDTVQISGTVNI